MRLHLEVVDTEAPPGTPPKPLDFTAGPVAIGRSELSQVVLEAETVSRTHAVLSLAGGQWFVAHQGSVAPTELNGVTLPRNTPMPVRTGDVVKILHWVLRVRVGAEPEEATRVAGAAAAASARATVIPKLEPYQSEFGMTIEAEPRGPAPGPAGRAVPTLAGVGAGGATYKLELREVNRPYVIGRSSGSDLVIPLGAISRRHAEVRYDGSRVYVNDAGARNPVRVNDRPIAGETPMSPGDVLGVGPVDLRLLADDPLAEGGATIDLGADAPAGGAAPWDAAADVPALEPLASGIHGAPSTPPAAQWDQLAQGAPSSDWHAAAAPPPSPPPPVAPAWDAAPPPVEHETPPPAWEPAPATPWAGPPPVGPAPVAPPPPAAPLPPVAPVPPVPAWTPPPMPAMPAVPAVPGAQFAVPPLPAIPPAPPPVALAAGIAGAVAGAGAAPPAGGVPPDAAGTRVITRRASSQRGWLVAGAVCMTISVVVGVLILVVA